MSRHSIPSQFGHSTTSNAPIHYSADTCLPTTESLNESLQQKKKKKAEQEKSEAIARRRELSQQLSALLREARVVSKVLKVTDNKLQNLRGPAIEHGRRACLQLCASLYATLPRELRDMVYNEILGSHSYGYVRRRAGFIKPGVLGNESISFVNMRPSDSSRPGLQSIAWWSVLYVGVAVATEIVERWYRTRTFVFVSKSEDVFPKFLTKNVFQKVSMPGFFVQHIRYHICADDVYDATLKARIIRNIKDLVRIQNRNVDLTVYIDATFLVPVAKLNATRFILENLGPIVYDMPLGSFARLKVKSSSPLKDLTFLAEASREDYYEKLKLLNLDSLPPC